MDLKIKECVQDVYLPNITGNRNAVIVVDGDNPSNVMFELLGNSTDGVSNQLITLNKETFEFLLQKIIGENHTPNEELLLNLLEEKDKTDKYNVIKGVALVESITCYRDNFLEHEDACEGNDALFSFNENNTELTIITTQRFEIYTDELVNFALKLYK